MTPSRKRVATAAALAAVLAAAWFSWTYATRRGGLDVRVLADQAPGPNEDGLVVEAAVLDPAVVRERLAAIEKNARTPGVFPPEALANSLLGGYLRVTIRNTSDRDLAVEPVGGTLADSFGVGVALADGSGLPLLPPFSGSARNSLKTLGPVMPKAPPEPVVLKAGESVVHDVMIWNGDGWTSSNDGNPPTGVYTGKITCVYTRSGDGAAVGATGAPVLVRVHREDVREWRRVHDALYGRRSLFARLCDALFP